MSALNTQRCISLFCAVIHSAVVEATTNESAVRFFVEKDSPFWEYCDHLGIDGNMIAEKVLRNSPRYRKTGTA